MLSEERGSSSSSPPAWHLVAPDGATLGLLEQVACDMFWTRCRFTPTPAFARVATAFAAELALLEADRMEEWETAYATVDALGLALRPVGDTRIPVGFLLHVDGTEAWFRE